jgi:hypothetical protein
MARKLRTKYFSEEWFQGRKEKYLCDRSRDFGVSYKNRLNDIMRWNIREDFTREELELIFYIICTQSSYNGTGKSRYDEDKIKCKIRKNVEKDIYEYWKLDENVTYWIDFFISFIVIYLTHMKLKQSKHEKELGEMKKEITRNRKEKRCIDIEKIRKYRDKKYDKVEKGQ